MCAFQFQLLPSLFVQVQISNYILCLLSICSSVDYIFLCLHSISNYFHLYLYLDSILCSAICILMHAPATDTALIRGCIAMHSITHRCTRYHHWISSQQPVGLLAWESINPMLAAFPLRRYLSVIPIHHGYPYLCSYIPSPGQSAASNPRHRAMPLPIVLCLFWRGFVRTYDGDGLPGPYPPGIGMAALSIYHFLTTLFWSYLAASPDCGSLSLHSQSNAGCARLDLARCPAATHGLRKGRRSAGRRITRRRRS